MGCFSSVNLSVAKEKKETSNNKPLNKTEIQNHSFQNNSCGNNLLENDIKNYNEKEKNKFNCSFSFFENKYAI